MSKDHRDPSDRRKSRGRTKPEVIMPAPDTLAAMPEAYPVLLSGIKEILVRERLKAVIVQRTVAQLPWRSNLTLLDKLTDPAIRLWYAQKALELGMGKDMLALVTPLQRCHACVRRSAPRAPAAEVMIKAQSAAHDTTAATGVLPDAGVPTHSQDGLRVMTDRFDFRYLGNARIGQTTSDLLASCKDMTQSHRPWSSFRPAAPFPSSSAPPRLCVSQ